MSADMHTAQPLTYQQIWDGYAQGEISTTVLRSLLRTDEVFRKWCERKAKAERKRQDAAPRISDEDMA
jgi:hypothetical protein